MDTVFGAFVYVDANPSDYLADLFEGAEEADDLAVTVEGYRIGLAKDEDVSVSLRTADEMEADVFPTAQTIAFSRGVAGLGGTSDPDAGCDAYVDLAERLYEVLPDRPLAGYALDPNHAFGMVEGGSPAPVLRGDLDSGRYNSAAWITFFPPASVDAHGRTTILDAPARRIEELGDGTIVVVADGDPTVYTEWYEVNEALELPAEI